MSRRQPDGVPFRVAAVFDELRRHFSLSVRESDVPFIRLMVVCPIVKLWRQVARPTATRVQAHSRCWDLHPYTCTSTRSDDGVVPQAPRSPKAHMLDVRRTSANGYAITHFCRACMCLPAVLSYRNETRISKRDNPRQILDWNILATGGSPRLQHHETKDSTIRDPTNL